MITRSFSQRTAEILCRTTLLVRVRFSGSIGGGAVSSAAHRLPNIASRKNIRDRRRIAVVCDLISRFFNPNPRPGRRPSAHLRIIPEPDDRPWPRWRDRVGARLRQGYVGQISFHFGNKFGAGGGSRTLFSCLGSTRD